MADNQKSRFIRRFDRIWAQARRVQLVQALCWGVLTLFAGLGLLAAADYWLEMSRQARMAGLSMVGIAALAVTISLVVRSLRRWQRGATAATIEEVFPQLGQRIRTTVQYGELPDEQVRQEGVATTLVTALEDDTVKVAQPLPLDAVIPWKSLALASLLAAMLGMGLAAAAAVDWQWRTAASRTILGGDEQYTLIDVKPGDLAVREGESATVEIAVEGRTGKTISFWSRRTDEEKSEWKEDTIPIEDAEHAADRRLEFAVPLDRVKHPLEYRVTAGTAESDIYRVDVLYPLKIVKIQAAVQPPEYTGIGEMVIEGGNIAALVGSQARLQVELDRAPETATLVLQSATPVRRGETPPAPQEIPLVIEDNKLSADLEIASDQTYQIVARSADGMELPESKYRIRARQDEAPHVSFESPSEALEVHTLAELLMRIRVSDDFGIARAGVIFEVNNEEEYPLLEEDFQAVIDAAVEAEETGKVSPKTRATLEKVLPLEHFELTQQDSIMYYAFAEDIKPELPNRTETDLRFVDIRPFRRLYRLLPDMDGMPMNQGPQLKSLEELIARQRHALNRTIQMSKKFTRTGQVDLAGIDNLIKFEGELAKSTRELAQGLQAMGIDETELLFQAEASMLTATDSLNAGNYDTATLQMRDALKALIEGRNRLQIFISKNRNRQLLAQLRQFDRMQQQKLRRPKSDEEEARELAERLEQLADQEDFVYATIAQMMGGGKPSEKTQGEPMEGSQSNQPSNSGQGSGDKPRSDPKEGDEPMPGDKPQGEGEKPAAEGDKPEGDKPEGNKPGEEGNEEKPGAGDEEKEGQPGAGKVPTPQEVEDKQYDIALEAREIEKVLGNMPKATDLAKERIANAAKMAEDAANSLGRGATQDAQNAIGEARGKFRELADQVRALLAEEQADRIAAAQQMAAELARRQDEFVDRLATPGEGGGKGKPKDDSDQPGMSDEERRRRDEERKAGLGGAAEEIAEKAKTLEDVLGAVGKGETPEDQATAEKVAEIAGSLELKNVIERLQNLPGQVGQGNEEDAKNNAGDGSERMEAASEQLAALHRVIVAPQVDELAKLEEKLTVLTEELDELETEPKVGGWHMDANDLLDQLDEAGIDEKTRQEFLDEMKKAGGGDDWTRKGWVLVDGRYQAPGYYRLYLNRLTQSVQNRMQELMLGDLLHSGDEPIPPQYQELVDRYYEVLVSSGKSRSPAKPVPTKAEPKQ